MSVTIQLRRGTAATWTSANPTLAQGEAGLETDTGKLKLGDGTTAWNSLAYFTGSAGVTGFATPSLALGTAAAAGSASTVIRSDATIAAFDATVPVTQALGDAAAAGTAAVAARRDHKHGMPALSTATPLVESGAGAAGTGTLSSREDHVHPAGGGGMTNPMTAQDDLIIGGASGTPSRLAKGSDGQVLTVDPTTHHLIWATPGSGSSPLTTKGDLYGFNTADARIPVGTDGQVLSADSTQTLGVRWADTLPASAQSQTLSADVTMTTGSTFYDGPSLSLAAGTWLVWGRVYIKNTTTQSEQPNARITDGTNVYDENGTLGPVSMQNFPLSIPLGPAPITLASTTTIKLSAAAIRSGQTMLRDVTNNSGSSHTATRIVAYRIG